MAKEVLQTTSTPFVRQDYERALVASGLVDDVTDSHLGALRSAGPMDNLPQHPSGAFLLRR
jgi:hypothetical protein